MNVEQQRARQPPRKPEIPDFTLLRLIGAGSYGDVWLARGVTGAYRAIKFVHRDRFDSDNAYEREFRGIQAFEPISRTHPNLVHLLHVGRDPAAGFYFYVMELADDASGGALADPDSYSARTLRSVLRSDKLELRESASIVQQLAEGLAHLHNRTLVHRDIKPSNIIFVGGTPKLGDIGLVSPPREDMSFVGTDGYIPPEGMGQPQADVFSLGKVLYELATGRDRMDFPELPSGPPSAARDNGAFSRLNTVILKACDPDPKRRFASADAMAKALKSPPNDAARGARAEEKGVRNRMFWAAAVAMMFVLAAMIWMLSRARQPADAAAGRDSSLGASMSDAVPITGADEGAPHGAKGTQWSGSGEGEQSSQTASGDSTDEKATPIPTRTVTTEASEEFLTGAPPR